VAVYVYAETHARANPLEPRRCARWYDAISPGFALNSS